MSNKKYFWLKLQRDFFKRHDSMIIESMENGKDYLLFYLKLLVESIDHEGELRFTDTIPYDEKMLSVITSTNIDIVRSAITVFSELKMIEILDDGTIFMNQIDKMLGSETYKAKSMRQLRAKKVTMLPDVTECYQEKEIDKEQDIEIDNSSPHFRIPIEYHKQINTRLAIMSMPTPDQNKTALELYNSIGDIDLVLKCLDSFFTDDYWFTRKNSKKRNDTERVYHFNTFAKMCISEILPHVKKGQSVAIAKKERAEKEKNKAAPPDKCPKCGKKLLQGTTNSVGCRACRIVYEYDSEKNTWDKIK